MRVWLLALVLLGSATAMAQVPDTLDARGYFPLAVGNEWQYRVERTGPFGTSTTTEFIRYRVVEGVGPSGLAIIDERPGGFESDTVSVRYDEETTSVLGSYVGTDGTTYESPFPFFACRLGLDFDDYDPQPGSSCWFYATRTDAYVPTPSGPSGWVPAKGFQNYVFGFTAVHGLGFVGGGGGCEPCLPGSSSESWRLTFARVDGQTYGTSFVAADAAPVVASLSLRASPNPSSGPLALTVSLGTAQAVRVAVFDALGRQVAVVFDGPATPLQTFPVDAGGWPAGVYVARATGAEGAVASTAFVVAR